MNLLVTEYHSKQMIALESRALLGIFEPVAHSQIPCYIDIRQGGIGGQVVIGVECAPILGLKIDEVENIHLEVQPCDRINLILIYITAFSWAL